MDMQPDPQLAGVVEPYGRRLDRNPSWALSEGSLFFEGRGAVQRAFRKVTARLGEVGIPYAVIGGMAQFRHGYRRFTEDIDLLVTSDSLKRIHEILVGRDCVTASVGGKSLRDAESGVWIKFWVTGEFPGDRKPKPVAFPDPRAVTIMLDGVRYINLSTLVELKLASGVSNLSRMKDLADVIAIIRALKLPRNSSHGCILTSKKSISNSGMQPKCVLPLITIELPRQAH